jgi:hypothetical protein
MALEHPKGTSLHPSFRRITQAEVIRKILRHLKLATDPPPIAPERVCQATFAWTSP